ncbi:putative iron-regulated membrane protein [Campylobacter blaseri]|nr:putative iron-regulated membrane protein [Campylobacter blaseri]
MFFIFFSGTFAYYKDSINLYMQPNFYKLNYLDTSYLKNSIEYLEENHKDDQIWAITPPSFKTPYVKVLSQDPKSQNDIYLNPENAKILNPYKTLGGDFISTLHYEPWGMNVELLGKIIGYLTIIILFCLISGLAIHKRLFKDFFKLKDRSFYYDMHIVTSVCGFIMFFTLIFSGLYLSEKYMLDKIYRQANIKKIENEKREEKILEQKREMKNILDRMKRAGGGSFMPKLYTPSYADIEKFISNLDNKDFINKIEIIRNPRSAILQINTKPKEIFTENGVNMGFYIYDLKSGQKIQEIDDVPINKTQQIGFLMRHIHIADFGGELTKFLFFIFGVFGMLMCSSGAILWTKKYDKSKFLKFIKVLNSTFFIGLFASFGIYLLANFFLSLENEARDITQIRLFFISLFIFFILNILVTKKYIYEISALITSLIFLVVVMVGVSYEAFLKSNLIIMLIIFLLISLFFGVFSLKGFRG